MLNQSVFVLIEDKLTVVTISELLYIAKPAGLVLMAEISPPNAPKAPPIDK